jgi:hypothetical protein
VDVGQRPNHVKILCLILLFRNLLFHYEFLQITLDILNSKHKRMTSLVFVWCNFCGVLFSVKYIETCFNMNDIYEFCL